MGDDNDLARALELSARDARTDAARPLLLPREGANSGAALPREALGPPLAHHFFATRRGRVQPGDIVSHGALDQFAAHWQPHIDAHGVASSICGYVTAANVELLCRCAGAHLSSAQTSWAASAAAARAASRTYQPYVTAADVEVMLEAVRDPAAVTPLVQAAMARVGAARAAWVDAHPAEYADGGRTGVSARRFYKGWVANYELSDLLAEDATAAPLPSRHFLRYNQFAQVEDATPDERMRIEADEARFGGRRGGDGVVVYAEGKDDEGGKEGQHRDSVFLIERFSGGQGGSGAGSGRVIQSPEEWAAAERHEEAAALAAAEAQKELREAGQLGGKQEVVPPLRIFALDLNGHYSAGFACRVGPRGRCTLVLVNSTPSVYADKPSVQWLYDTLFPPTPESGVLPLPPPPPPAGAVAHGVVPDSSLQDLIGMGFSEEMARAALVRVNGSIAAAVDVLLGGAGS